jgi:hypothetical protein
LTFPIRFQPGAASQYCSLRDDPQRRGIFGQVKKALRYLEENPRHPSLRTHEFRSLEGPNKEKVYEAYAQNNTPGAYRIFFCYMKEGSGSEKQPVISVIAITPHP